MENDQVMEYDMEIHMEIHNFPQNLDKIYECYDWWVNISDSKIAESIC